MHYCDSHLNATFGVFFRFQVFFPQQFFHINVFSLSPFWLNFLFLVWQAAFEHMTYKGIYHIVLNDVLILKKFNYTTEVLFLNIGDQVSIIIYCIIFLQIFFINLFPYFIPHSIFFAHCFALSHSIFRSPHFHFK